MCAMEAPERMSITVCREPSLGITENVHFILIYWEAFGILKETGIIMGMDSSRTLIFFRLLIAGLRVTMIGPCILFY